MIFFFSLFSGRAHERSFKNSHTFFFTALHRSLVSRFHHGEAVRACRSAGGECRQRVAKGGCAAVCAWCAPRVSRRNRASSVDVCGCVCV